MFHIDVHDLAKNMVGHFDGEALNVLVALEGRYNRLQNREDDVQISFARAPIAVHLVARIRGVVVAGDGENRLAIVDVELDTALIASSLGFEFHVELAAEKKRIFRFDGENRLASQLQVFKVLTLQFAAANILDLSGRNHLGRSTQPPKKKCNRKDATASHTTFPERGRADQKPSLYMRSTPGCRTC